MEKYKQLIAKGETEAALNLLMEQRDQHSANTSKAIVVLKAAWTNLKKQQMGGTIAPEDAERVYNRIINPCGVGATAIKQCHKTR